MNQYTNDSHDVPFSDKKKKDWIVSQARKFWDEIGRASCRERV